ncbi:uncharacterized protein LOC131243189 isoform X2 [Magnolia sinica]|uniref:uncharacterized protein LOC131243189 isoform X2 n=1 Tax=Magnolia sinica TaxID=86752 RepID=UPI0026598235|nr:uncharacterized protein LOC131243189 isoform X2 [Magnolia sinica]
MEIEEEMQRQKKDGDTLISRTEVWIKTHTRKDGSVHSNAASHVEKVKELLASEGSNSHDILNDPLTQVFGPDTRGRVRGVGTTVSQSQIRGSAAALEKISSYKGKVEEQSSTIQEQSFKIQELSSKIDFLTDQIGGIKEMIQQHMDSIQPENPQSTGGPSVGNHQCVERMRPCKLYSWRKELVAQGRVILADGPQMIHGKPLQKDLYKVAIDVIIKGDVELPEPDGYHSTLGEVGIGSFVAWHHCFTEFTD